MSWESAKTDYETANKALDEAKARNDSEEKLRALAKTLSSKEPLYNALKKVDAAQTELNTAVQDERNAQSGSDESAKARYATAVDEAKAKLAKLKDDAAYVESVGSLRAEQEVELKQAWADIYRYEKEIREAQEAKDANKEKEARGNLEAAKARWQLADRALQAYGTKDSVQSLEGEGVQTLKNAIDGHLKSLESDISTLQAQLGSTGAGLANAPNAIIGVAEDKTLIHANDAAANQIGSSTAALGEESADVWTRVAFSVGTQSDTSSTKESNISASADLEVRNWWTRVKASSSFSSSSKKIESAMSSCRVDGSFSAMVVNIKRPWLHSDLFQDFDIDIADNTKLSPGAAQIKEWVENGDTGSGAIKRTDYGKFPAYPTAFIVAADTVLEVCNPSSDNSELLADSEYHSSKVLKKIAKK